MSPITRRWLRKNALKPGAVTSSACRRCRAKRLTKANNVLQTVEHQLAKAVASRDLAKLDLERTVIRAPADGWVTNLNVYAGEFITRGSTAVALVKQNTFYVMAYPKRLSWKACVRAIAPKSLRSAVVR